MSKEKNARLPTFIVTLPEAKERQEHMKRQMDDLGLDFEWFEAVDGRGFDVPALPEYDARRRRRNYGRDLKGGEIGCLLSHKKLYQKIVEEQIPLTLVLEDDAILHEDFAQAVGDVQQCETPFDLVRFLGSKKLTKARQRVVEDLTPPYQLCRLYGLPGGTHAYMITLDGARKMLRVMDRYAFPIDTLMGREWDTKCMIYVVMPGPAVSSEDLGSFIGDARFDKKGLDVGGASRALYPLTRAAFKLHETMMKAWMYWVKV